MTSTVEGLWDDAGDHGNRLGFAGSVGAKETKHFPFFDFKADFLDGLKISILLNELIYFKDCRHEKTSGRTVGGLIL